MLSLRQVAPVVWTFLAFMIAAALVLNLRYKSIGEGQYFDTWTGQIRPAERVEDVEGPVVLDVTGSVPEIALRAERLRLEGLSSDCSRVRFAFPAPEPTRRY